MNDHQRASERPSHESASERRSASARRMKYGAFAALLIAAVTVSGVLATLLATKAHLRIDVTATREHTLSPRTLSLLNRLSEPYEIIIVADLALIDSTARQRVNDTLIEFDRASSFVTFSVIDAGSAGDRAAYLSLLARLASLQQDELDARIKAESAALDIVGQLAGAMSALSDQIKAVRDQAPQGSALHRKLDQQAAVARTWIAQLARVHDTADKALQRRIAGSTMPAVDEAKQALALPLRRLSSELDALRTQFEGIQADFERAGADAGRDAAARVAASLSRLRDTAAASSDSLSQLAPIDVVAVARALEAGPAAVIVSSKGATAIEFSSLFPTAVDLMRQGAVAGDIAFQGEELVSTALATLNDASSPIIVFVHGQPARYLDDAGQPASGEAATLLQGMLDRLGLHGFSFAEWATSTSDARPNLSLLDPVGDRPVVWVVISLAPTTTDAAQRMGKLSAVIEQLVKSGESVLLSASPSTLPAVGEADPMVAFLEPLGLHVDTGRPLLHRTATPQGPVVTPGELVTPRESDQPIAAAIRGLPTLLPWPLPITQLNQAPGVTIQPLLEVAASDDDWAESQWLGFSSLSPSQRSMVRNPPEPTPGRDNLNGPWLVGASIERQLESATKPQRLIVVASNGWFFDEFTQASRISEGRTSRIYPGNAELFEACAQWLAGQEELIAPSPQAHATPRIAPLTRGQLLALRWALIAGLPALILLTGLVTRLVRG